MSHQNPTPVSLAATSALSKYEERVVKNGPYDRSVLFERTDKDPTTPARFYLPAPVGTEDPPVTPSILRELTSLVAASTYTTVGSRFTPDLYQLSRLTDPLLLPSYSPASTERLALTAPARLLHLFQHEPPSPSLILTHLLVTFAFYQKLRTEHRPAIASIQDLLNDILLETGLCVFVPGGFSASFLRSELYAWGFERQGMFYPTLNFRPVYYHRFYTVEPV